MGCEILSHEHKQLCFTTMSVLWTKILTEKMLDLIMRRMQNKCRFDKSLLFIVTIRNGHWIEENLLHWATHFITQSNYLWFVPIHTSSTVKPWSLLELFTILSGNQPYNNKKFYTSQWSPQQHWSNTVEKSQPFFL